MARWQDYVLQGTRADQPAASSVAVGTLYSVTDELNLIERSDGTDWQTYGPVDFITVDAYGALYGDGSSGDPLGVNVDNVTIEINGSDELGVIGGIGSTYRSVGGTFTNGGSELVEGLIPGTIVTPYDGVIVGVYLMADTAGDLVLDIWKLAAGSYPPTVADTITASAKPTLSGADFYFDSTLTGWTTAVSIGDQWRFYIDPGPATITSATLQVIIALA